MADQNESAEEIIEPEEVASAEPGTPASSGTSRMDEFTQQLKQNYYRVRQKLSDMQQGEPSEPEEIDIPVESLGRGIWNTINEGVNTVTTVGGYAVTGVKYGVQDGIGLANMMVGFTKGKLAKNSTTDEPAEVEKESKETGTRDGC